MRAAAAGDDAEVDFGLAEGGGGGGEDDVGGEGEFAAAAELEKEEECIRVNVYGKTRWRGGSERTA